ncbi:MAG: hypothetical protein AAF578_02760 [Pseudomonadota bacterium]
MSDQEVLLVPVPTGETVGLHGYGSTIFVYGAIPGVPIGDVMGISAAVSVMDFAWNRIKLSNVTSRLEHAGLELRLVSPELTLVQRVVDTVPISTKVYEPRPDELDGLVKSAGELASRHNAQSVVMLWVYPSLTDDLTRFRLDVRQRSFYACSAGALTCKKGPSRSFVYLGEQVPLDLVEAAAPDWDAENDRLDVREAKALAANPENAESIKKQFAKFRRQLSYPRFMQDVRALEALWTKDRLNEEYAYALDELTDAIELDWARIELNQSIKNLDKWLTYPHFSSATFGSKAKQLRFENGRSLYLTRNGTVVSVPGEPARPYRSNAE